MTPRTVLQPIPAGWDDGNIYRASFTVDGDWLRIWYSARSSSGQWRVGYTEGDLDDFLTPPLTTWSEIHGNVQRHHRACRAPAPTACGRTAARPIRRSSAPSTDSDVCVNVWYWEELSTATDFMALLRLWDTGRS